MTPVLYIVIPCYNEQEVLPITAPQFLAKLRQLTEAGKIASRAGGSLSFDSKPAPIESGFILSYGGIEENCSLKSIFAANKDQIQDTAMKVLFS